MSDPEDNHTTHETESDALKELLRVLSIGLNLLWSPQEKRYTVSFFEPYEITWVTDAQAELLKDTMKP